MKKFEKKLNVAIVLSIVAIALSGTMSVLWCCNAGGFSAVDLDTFVGVIVALLAIIVTIAIGWQISNAMDIRAYMTKLDERICKVEKLESQFEEQKQQVKQLNNEAKHFSNIAIAETYKREEKYVDAFRFYLSALKCGLQLTTPLNLLPMIKAMKDCSNSIKSTKEISPRLQDSINKNDQLIRSSPLFKTIQDDYEKIYDLFWKKVKKDQK